MVTAIVLIRAERGKTSSLAQDLLEIPEVAEVFSVTGEYDLIAIIRAKEYADMAEIVPNRLQALDGMERTETLMAFQCYSRHDLDRLFSIGLEEPATEA
ncbi:MAG TPA: Lrp/AsnC ligand binding domain-containing protein [Chloroflexota bacterium]|nr:Lrp/AsnC ligand binding domain-containing protein [Chloroflexota bacterium]